MSVLAAASTSAFDQPGTLGFLVVAGIGIILVFLFRSMTRHLRKVSGVTKGSGAGNVPGAAQVGQPGADGQGAAQTLASAPDDAGRPHE